MNTQKGFAPILLILAGLIVIGGGVYFYTSKPTQNNTELVLGNETQATTSVVQFDTKESKKNKTEATSITVYDLLKITYSLYINDNGKAGSEHDIVFAGVGKNFKVGITRVGEAKTGIDPVEYFWIDDFFINSDSGEARVYVMGEMSGGTLSEGKMFYVKYIDGKLVAKELAHNWKTMYFDRWGISVKYPDSIITIDRDSGGADKVWFKYNTGPIIGSGIAMSIEMRNVSVEDFVKEYTSQDEFNKIESKIETVIDDASATKLVVTSALGLSTTYLLVRENNTTYIVHYYEGNDENLYHKTILSTFKFLN